VNVTNSINLFNKLNIDSNGNVDFNLDRDTLYCANKTHLHNTALVGSSYISGIIDTFHEDGVSELNTVTHSIAGHTHNAGTWSDIETTTLILCPVIQDGNNIYSLKDGGVVGRDYNDTNEWHAINQFRNTDVEYDYTSRIHIEGNNYALFGKNKTVITINGIKPPLNNSNICRGAVYPNDSVYYELNDNYIRTLNGESFRVEPANNAEAYKVDNYTYFVMNDIGKLNGLIYKYNGLSLETISTGVSIKTSTVWKNDIILLDIYGRVYKYDGTELTIVGDIPSFEQEHNPVRIHGIDSVLFVEYAHDDIQYINLYNLNDNLKLLSIEYLLSQDIESNGNPISVVYGTNGNIGVQLGSKFIHTNRNLSTALSLDVIDGLCIMGSGNITADNIVSPFNVINGRTSKSFTEIGLEDKKKISDDPFILEPGRGGGVLDRESGYVKYPDYTMDDTHLKDSYIDRHVINDDQYATYTDTTCSTVYNNELYLGHRGSISVINGDDVTPKPQKDKVISKFIPTSNGLYALAQDFSNGVNQNTESQLFDETTQYIPTLAEVWSVPHPTLLIKDDDAWKSDDINSFYGIDMIDCVSYNNNLYILSHINGSGVMCYKHDLNEPNNQIETGYVADMDLNEYLNDTTYITSQGKFVVDSSGNYIVTNRDVNTGYHKFYMYNKNDGPYIIHDHIELLYTGIGSSEVGVNNTLNSSGNITQTYDVDVNGKNLYNYRVIDVSYADTGDVSNVPFAKIIVEKDSVMLHSININNTQYMRSLGDLSNKRKTTKFITSVTSDDNIFILMQTQSTTKTMLNIYKISCDYLYHNKTPDGDKTTFGGYSRVGIDTDSTTVGTYQYIDFTGIGDYSNYLYSSIDITNALNIPDLTLLGDGDDLFALLDNGHPDYRNARVYSNTSYCNTGNVTYVPLLARSHNPDGSMHNPILAIYGDGTCKLIDDTSFVYRPVGRSHIINDEGKLTFASMKLDDDQSDNVTVIDNLSDSVQNQINESTNRDEIHSSLSTRYNVYGNKHLITGEYDMLVKDVLNIKEKI